MSHFTSFYFIYLLTNIVDFTTSFNLHTSFISDCSSTFTICLPLLVRFFSLTCFLCLVWHFIFSLENALEYVP
uniref:Uncharacterized protein n=1 Tax=Desmodus rotundus TaxID=9430 RepID=K9IW13_DESRO